MLNALRTGRDATTVPVGLGLLAGAGSAAALLATYWDDSWHTDKGRDDFAIPPHLLLYGGVLVASLAVAAWGLMAWRRAGWGVGGVRSVLGDPALLLAGIGGATTLASGPVDAAWHEIYGRDAVIWSPPHLTAVLGTLALSVGLLAGLRLAQGRAGALARLLAAAGVIGTLQVPVLEYDSDVPQFSVLWFLPVAALGVCAAVALLNDLLPGPREAVGAAVVYTLLRAGTVAFLAAAGFSLTLVPPVVVAFALAALLRDKGPVLRLILLGAAVPLVWWPFLRLQADVTTLVPLALLPGSVALGALAGLLVALAHGDLRLSRAAAARTAVVVAALALAVGAVPGQDAAWAHDPGQGEQLREGELTVAREGGTARITMELPGACDGLTAGGAVARRAGQALHGPLRVEDAPGGCRLDGTVDGLGEGRWFVYAEARDDDGTALEAWLPAAPGETDTEVRPLYAPPVAADAGTRNAAGAALLAVCAALLVACLRLARRSRAFA
ncbi:MAG: hypothetical protein Q8R60_14790 [Mycobacteriales bacterium]|nr:hypothetical protein [Mycobacteriales bacterium]